MVVEDTTLLMNLYHKYGSKTKAAKEYCELKNLKYSNSFRRRTTEVINILLKNNGGPVPKSEQKELSALNDDGTIMTIKEYCDFYKIPIEQIKSYKLVTHTGTPYYNIQSNQIVLQDFDKFTKDLLEDIEKISPKIEVERPKLKNEEKHLLVIDPADIHLGKLVSRFETGKEYNEEIAIKRVMKGVDGILEKVSGFHIEKILFIAGNDVLHFDNPKSTTTSGTFQDSSGMWYDNFLKAKQLYIDVLLKLLQIAPIHFMYNPSNHDYMTGFFLADVIKTYFKNTKDITFDTSMAHRKYFRYGDNLIGTTHGDGAKEKDLPMLMAHEAKDWSKTSHRYIYTHHVHHKMSKDYIGVTIESLRSPSPEDSWHHRNGFVGTPEAIEAYIHHKKRGQVARITHIFT